jgi:hypothetical protein
MTGFLVFSEVTACAASYTKHFGDAGGLLIEYEMTTTTPKSRLVFKNIISGTLTNTMNVLIRCTIEPIAPGYSSAFRLDDVALDAGASQTFSREASFLDERSVLANKKASPPTIAGWNAECSTPLDYEFSNQAVTTKFSAGVITGVIGRKGVAITVENNSDQPIEIVWNDSSFIDMNRSARRIFHYGVKYVDRDRALPNTMIPPLAKIEDAAIPTENLSLTEGRFGGWTEAPLFPSEVSPELAERTIASMKGAKVALFLQLMVGEKKTPVTLLFEVAAVKPGGPKQPGS